MALFGAVVGAAIGGIAGAITSYANTNKRSNAYEKASKSLRDAAEKYSGDKAADSIRNAGYQEGRLVNNGQLDALRRVNQSNPLSIQNFNNNDNNIQNYDMSAANNVGREREANKLQGKYNYETAAAQRLLNQENIEANAQQQMFQSGANALGGLVNTYNQVKGSDERMKEPINNESGLPKSDIEDSLRQIETIQYKYKNPNQKGADDEIHESGVTAQSLEKTPLFKDSVETGKDGYKRIDEWKLVEALTAGIAQLQREIDELEGK